MELGWREVFQMYENESERRENELVQTKENLKGSAGTTVVSAGRESS